MSRYNNIFEIITEIKPKHIIEIGTWNGIHAEKMINLAQSLRPSELIYYTGFDLFEDFTEAETEFCPKKPANFIEVRNRLIKTNNKIHLEKGNTRDTLSKISFHPVDFIFMDGGHSLETIASDWHNIQKFIKNSTTILLDDYYIHNTKVGCRTLVDKLVHDPKWLVEPLEPIDPCNDGTQMVRINLNL